MKVVGLATLALVAAASVDAQQMVAPARTYSTGIVGAPRGYTTSTSGLSAVSRPLGDAHSVLGHTDVYRTSGATTLPARTYSTGTVGAARSYTTSTSGLAAVTRPMGDAHSALGHTDIYRTGVSTLPARTYTTGSTWTSGFTSGFTSGLSTYRPSSLASKYEMVDAEAFDATIVDVTPDGEKRGRAMTPPTPAPYVPKVTTTAMPGSNKCTWGPSYWCASEANAKECNYTGDCARYATTTTTATAKPVLGANKCTQGPSYFCGSEEQAKECNYEFAKCAKYFDADFNRIAQTGTTLSSTSTISATSGLTTVSRPLGDAHSVLGHTDVYRTSGATTLPARTYSTGTVGAVRSYTTSTSGAAVDPHAGHDHGR